MAVDDIWRVAMVARTFNQVAPLPEQFFEWVVVYHYETTVSSGDDAAESGDLMIEQIARQTDTAAAFAGDTRIFAIETLNLNSFFSDVQFPDTQFGDPAKKCLPPQVAVAVSGKGVELGRRAMKFWSAITVELLGDDGTLLFNATTNLLLDNTYRLVTSPPVGRYSPVLFGELQLPQVVPITDSKLSDSWRTQRRRVLDLTQ